LGPEGRRSSYSSGGAHPILRIGSRQAACMCSLVGCPSRWATNCAVLRNIRKGNLLVNKAHKARSARVARSATSNEGSCIDNQGFTACPVLVLCVPPANSWLLFPLLYLLTVDGSYFFVLNQLHLKQYPDSWNEQHRTPPLTVFQSVSGHHDERKRAWRPKIRPQSGSLLSFSDRLEALRGCGQT
jgi:hypothetical protein